MPDKNKNNNNKKARKVRTKYAKGQKRNLQNNVNKTFAKVLSVLLGLLEVVKLAADLRCIFNGLQAGRLLPSGWVSCNRTTQLLKHFVEDLMLH
jgi:hypothetical protein